jgi:hypothetical protein
MLINNVTASERWTIKNEEIHFVALENIDAKYSSESSLIQSMDGVNQLVEAFNQSEGSISPSPILPLFVYYVKKSEELKTEVIVKPPPPVAVTRPI